MENNNCCSGCNRPDLPWAGRGTKLDISGCRFSLYPMTDNFVPIILGALEGTDTSAVWSESDALSTVYRGKLPYVADAVKALFVNAWKPDVHMALEGQFSKGCPGDCDGDSVLTREGEAPTRQRLRISTSRYCASWHCIPWEPRITSMRLPESGDWQRRRGWSLPPFITPPGFMVTFIRCLTTWKRYAA